MMPCEKGTQPRRKRRGWMSLFLSASRAAERPILNFRHETPGQWSTANLTGVPLAGPPPPPVRFRSYCHSTGNLPFLPVYILITDRSHPCRAAERGGDLDEPLVRCGSVPVRHAGRQ